MKLTNIGSCKTIDEFVNYKIGLFEGKDKNFHNLFNNMFTEGDNVMVERTNGHRIIKTTYKQCETDIYRIASILSDTLKGVDKGAMVGIYMKNSLEWIETFWGLLMSGYVPVLMNTRLADETLNDVIVQYNIKAVISDGETFNVPSYNGLELAKMDEIEGFKPSWADEIVVMSSGTSENVKLCVYNGESFYYQLCNTVEIIKQSNDIKRHYEGELKLLTFLPFYHIFGLAAVYIWFSFFARTFVVLNDLGADTILNTVRKHKVTHIFAVPLLWNRIYDAAVKKIKDRGEATFKKFNKGLKLAQMLDFCPGLARAFSKKAFKEVRDNLFGDSICFLIAGGSHISPEVITFFNSIGYPLANGFGMSEVGITSVETSDRARVRNTGTVGKPFLYAEYKIAEDGELLIRGKGTSVRILNGEDVLYMSPDTWFSTKDIVSEKNGRFYIQGRKDDMIPCKSGENLNPNRIETQLMIPGLNGVCLISKISDKDVLIPVLLIQVSRYATAERINYLRKALDDRLLELKLAGTINDIVFTTEPLMGENEFKLNRHRLSRLYKEGKIELIVLDKMNQVAKEVSPELLKEVKAIFAEALSIAEDELGEDAHFFFDLDGSSLDYLSIMADIQKKYEISFHQSDEGNLVTVREFCKYIQDNI